MNNHSKLIVIIIFQSVDDFLNASGATGGVSGTSHQEALLRNVSMGHAAGGTFAANSSQVGDFDAAAVSAI